MNTEVERFEKAIKAADKLAAYRAVVRPAHHCGCRVFFPVSDGGLRCARCMPPLGMPEGDRRIVNESFDLVDVVEWR